MKPAARLFLAGLLVFWGTGCFPGEHKAQLTVRVTDDEGKPVADAMVAVLGFNRERKGRTDRDGRFTATLRNGMSGVDIVVDKQSYYSIGRHIYDFPGGYVDDRWQPWNPTIELQLRKKGKPVAMFEKEIQGLQVPLLDQPVGFDLEHGDWISPYGQGRISDFIFLAHSAMTNEQEYASKLLLTFSNPQDGLIIKRIHWRNDYGLVLPGIAPEVGYSNRWEFVLNVHYDQASKTRQTVSNTSEDDNYYIRVRTRTAPDGRIQSAMYGKIHRGILHRPEYPSGKVSVGFYYYLNTNGTRNTESLSDRRRYGDLP
jgi:hypothetical protein